MRARPVLLCAVLGANLWATVVLVPALYGGRHGLVRLLVLLPLALLGYAVAVTVAFHLFVVRLEEPLLRRRFGSAYEAYCQSVRRWLPGRGAKPSRLTGV